jgi:hypothetical protein
LFAALVAIFTVIVLICTLVDVRKATVEANRAWIATRNAFFDPQLPPPTNPGDPFYVAVTYDNPGKEPALNASRYQEPFWTSYAPFVEQLRVEKNNTCSKLTSETNPVICVVWPGGDIGQYTSRGSNPPIRADREFLNQHKILGYHGCFRYETFGEPHFTAYCYILDPRPSHSVADWLWGLCPGAHQNFAN